MTNYEREVLTEDKQIGDVEVHKTKVNVQTADQGIDRVKQVIYYVLSVIDGLLVVRFVLSLFGANTSNSFAKFIYQVTTPFVRMFQTLFSVDTRYGVSHLEIETIFAIIMVVLVGWLIISAINLTRKDLHPVDQEV